MQVTEHEKKRLWRSVFRLPSAHMTTDRLRSMSYSGKKINQVLSLPPHPVRFKGNYRAQIVEQVISPTGLLRP